MNMYAAVEYVEESYEHDSSLDKSENTQQDTPLALGVVFYIIGDTLQEFADNNVILKYSEALLHLKTIAPIAKCIVIGQGVSRAEVLHFQAKLQTFSALRPVPVLHRLNEKIEKKYLDKLDDKNVLITHPVQQGSLQFTSHLVVDDDCALMRDCCVGEHLHGMLLIEAAKQLFMASVRRYDVAPAFAVKQEEMRFTLSGLHVQFDNFVFPLAAQLYLTLSDININGASASGAASIKIMQFGRLCSEITFYANAHTAKIFSSLEKRCAIKAKRRLDFTQAYF